MNGLKFSFYTEGLSLNFTVGVVINNKIIFVMGAEPSNLTMKKRNPASDSFATTSVQYHKLTKSDDGFVDMQFNQPPPKIPYKAITLAIILFLTGTLLIVIGALLLTGYIDTAYADRTWPVLILGTMMFIPGAYHVHLAYNAWKGYAGYSFDDIPEFE